MKRNKINKDIAKKIISVVSMLAVSLTFISGNTKAEAESIPESTPTMEIIDRRDYWKEHPEECPFEEISKAYAMAKVADAICPDGASKECLSAVMCCVWNRVHTNGFPNTLEEVANQPYQWQGMAADFQPNDNVKKLAREKLNEWESDGIHVLPIPRNHVYLWLDTDGIWFRSEWDGNDEVFVEYF